VPLNNPLAVEKAFAQFKDEIACVIIEPVPANNGLLLQGKEFLQFLRKITTENNSLLVFDEVITGFRLGFCGAAGLYDIQPDIITYGKILGGGFPVGAYGASKEIMGHISPEGNVYQAGTLSGNPVAMSAGVAQLTECLTPGFYEDLEKKTQYLLEGIRKINPFKPFKLFQKGSIFWIAFTEKDQISDAADIDPNSMSYFKVLYHNLLENGVYFGPSGYEVGFISQAHSYEDLDQTIAAFERSLSKLV
jgi:glutamate-1-semialdehyde 2,1-aminomutase